MSISTSAKFSINVALAALLLASCSNGSGSSSVAPSGIGAPQTGTATRHASVALLLRFVTLSRRTLQHLNMHDYTPIAFVKPNCCSYTKTTFITDYLGGSSQTGAVYLFDFTSGAFIGQLAPPPEGFLGPQGACTDAKGNVWITNTYAQTIDQFSHDGTYIRSVTDPYGLPSGCAINKSDGDLAVTNFLNPSGSYPGNLVVYSNASGSGTEYLTTRAGVLEPYFAGYAGKTGNLFISGENRKGFAAAELSGGKVNSITLKNAPIEAAGGVTWSAQTKSINFGDQYSSTYYHINPTTLTSTGATTIACNSGNSHPCDIDQATVKGKTIVAPNANCCSANNYGWPSGTLGVGYVGPQYELPVGSAVSPDVP